MTIKPLKEQEKDEEDAIIKSHNSIPFIKNMKLLLIGDVKSGKTSFINSFFNQQNNSYEHTSCLEIKKNRFSISS